MKTLNQRAAARDIHNSEPILLARIKWNSGQFTGGAYGYYAERDYDDGIDWQGRILSFGGITNQKRSDASANVSTSSMVLDDSNGKLKAIFDDADLVGSEVTLYVHFGQEDNSASTELFTGIVAGPIEWSEGERTLSFSVISNIISKQIGYAIEEDEFDYRSDDAVGQTWPMVFGKAAHVPAVRAQVVRHSTLDADISLAGNVLVDGLFDDWNITGDGEVDAKDININGDVKISTIFPEADIEVDTVVTRLNRIYVKDNEHFPTGEKMQVEIKGVIFEGQFVEEDDKTYFAVSKANTAKWRDIAFASRPTEDSDKNNPKVAWLLRTDIDLGNHHTLIRYSVKFPGGKARIYFAENICVRQEGTKCWFKYPFVASKTPGAAVRAKSPWVLPDGDTVISAAYPMNRLGLTIELDALAEGLEKKLKARRIGVTADKKATGSGMSPIARQLELVAFLKNAFWGAEEGATIREWGGSSDVYVANTFESNTVNAVFGRRKTKDGDTVLSAIPSDYYTVSLSQTIDRDKPRRIAIWPKHDEEIVELVVTTLTFARPLESYLHDGWTGEVFVTLTSSVGHDGNTGDQIEYIIDNYTNLTPSGNFKTSHLYPSHFAIFDKKDAIALAREMAWQSRHALIQNGEDVSLKYISAKPSSDLIIGEGLTEFQSLEFSVSEIYDIGTSFKAKWLDKYAKETELDTTARELILEINTSKYGFKEREFDFYIYNDEQSVEQSLGFWSSRLSQSWRLVKLKTFTDAMGLEPFDCVYLSHPDLNLNSDGRFAIVESITNNINDGSVELELWLPVIAGEDGLSEYAYLQDNVSRPSNPADGLVSGNVALHYYAEDYDVQEVVRELRKLEQRSRTLAKIVEIDEDNYSRCKVDLYEDGPFEEPTELAIWVYDINPHHNLTVGDWVDVEAGQDGVSYCYRYVFPPMFGYINALKGADGNHYLVQLQRFGHDGGDQVPVDWNTGNPTDTQIVEAICVDQPESFDDFDLMPGILVELKPISSADDFDAEDDVSWFFHTFSRKLDRGYVEAEEPWLELFDQYIHDDGSIDNEKGTDGQFIGEGIRHINTATDFENQSWAITSWSSTQISIERRQLDLTGHAHATTDTSVIHLSGADTDELVAAISGQTPGYLGDVLTTSDAWLSSGVVGADVNVTHNDPSTETYTVSLSGDSWINVDSDTVGFDAKGHHTDVANLILNISHDASPGGSMDIDILTDIDLAFASNSFGFPRGQVNSDSAGHVTGSATITPTEAVAFAGDTWLSVATALASNTLTFTYEHATPFTAETLERVNDIDVTLTDKFTLNFQDMDVDDAGHITANNQVITGKTVSFYGGDNLTLVTTHADTKNVEFTFDHDSAGSTNQTVTIDTGTGLDGSGTLTFDSKGHSNNSTKSITLTLDLTELTGYVSGNDQVIVHEAGGSPKWVDMGC